MSSRPDRDKALVPLELAENLLLMVHLDHNDEWVQRAEWLVGATVESTTDRREAIGNADHVITTSQ